jgi:dihydrofolate reductase
MGTCRFQLALSLDGFVAGPDQSEENPLGVRGLELHQWVFPLEVWRRQQGQEGGEVNTSTPVIEEAQANVGATVMGRNMFGGGPGPWPEDPPWNGWWGDNPPYHTPVFVLTHHPREPLELAGGTTFFFVTGGIESAYKQVKQAAGDGTCCSAGAPAWSSSTWPSGWSTSSGCTWSRSCSGTASGCWSTSATSRSSRCARSRHPGSPTSSTASSRTARVAPPKRASTSFARSTGRSR